MFARVALELDSNSVKRLRFPYITVAAIVLLLAASAVMGYYVLRWYTEGEEPPISVPLLATADPSVDESHVTDDQVSSHTVPALNPRYLSIPEIAVDKSRVFATGITDSNQLEAPGNLSDLAWFDQTDTPGSGGVMLINGHNGGITRNGVFAQLGLLDKGDIITIERGDGEVFKYEVRENVSMTLEEVNSTGMSKMMKSAEDGVEALNLITCDGKWVPRYQQFDRRIMLRAVLVDE